MLICASCGSEEQEGSAFCGNCGAPLAPPTAQPEADEPTRSSTSASVLTCASCGSEEPESSSFCGNCGASLPPADPQLDHTESAETSVPTEVVPESADSPATTAPSDSWPTAAAPPDLPPPPPTAAVPRMLSRRPSRPVVVATALALLLAAAAAVLFGTGAVGGSSGKSESSFAREVNEKVLVPLGQATTTATARARTTNARAAGGGRIVQVANEAVSYLRTLSGDLSARQQSEVQVLLAFIAANGRYGQALASFDPADSQSRLALDAAAGAARATRAQARSALSTDLQLPSQSAFVSAKAISPPAPAPVTTTTTTTAATTAPAPADAVAYVQQVDELLRRSHAVVLALRSFIPRASRDAISRSEAVTAARSYLDQRRLELARAQALTVPAAFASAQGLLIRALQLSAADDEALVAWAVARRDNSGNAQAALAQANQIGAQATALKQQFLRVYGQQRQAATGRSPASLPDIF